MTCSQVEHTRKECDKHIGFIAFCQCIVEGISNTLRVSNMGRDIAEQRTGDSHKHGRGNTLARHVANAKEELIVTDIEVEEVATHRLGWCQRTIDIDIVALRIGRESLRQHRHLDIMGYLQLTLHSCLLGCRITQLIDIAGQGLLHVLKRITQLVDFVTTLNVRQMRLEVTFGHLVGRDSQLPQWRRGLLDAATAYEEHNQQS